MKENEKIEADRYSLVGTWHFVSLSTKCGRSKFGRDYAHREVVWRVTRGGSLHVRSFGERAFRALWNYSFGELLFVNVAEFHSDVLNVALWQHYGVEWVGADEIILHNFDDDLLCVERQFRLVRRS